MWKKFSGRKKNTAEAEFFMSMVLELLMTRAQTLTVKKCYPWIDY